MIIGNELNEPWEVPWLMENPNMDMDAEYSDDADVMRELNPVPVGAISLPGQKKQHLQLNQTAAQRN